MTPHPLILMLAQTGPAGLGAKLTGLATQLVGFLLGIVVVFGLIWLLVSLMKSMLKKPSFETLAMIAGLAIGMVFLAGAAPDLLDAAYLYGQTFMDGTP